jgi:F-type H+-transporting ATPase subunit delta
LDATAHQRLIDEYIDQVSKGVARTGSTDVADKDAIVRSYAEALFRVADAEGELDAVERRLFAFAELLERETRVRDALLDPSLPIENKRQLIADTLRERANPLAVNLLGFLVEQGRAREIGRIVEALAEVVAATRERAVAEVRSAVPLGDARAKRLAGALSRADGTADRGQGDRRSERGRWRRWPRSATRSSTGPCARA